MGCHFVEAILFQSIQKKTQKCHQIDSVYKARHKKLNKIKKRQNWMCLLCLFHATYKIVRDYIVCIKKYIFSIHLNA